MRTLSLLHFTDETTLQLIKDADRAGELLAGDSSCFWLGSVSLDPKKLQQFLKAAKEDRIDEMQESSFIGDEFSYSVLVRSAVSAQDYHVFVFKTSGGIDQEPTIILARKLGVPFHIEGRRSAALPKGLLPKPRKELWKAFFAELARPFHRK